MRNPTKQALAKGYLVTWPATAFQVAIGNRVEGEINAMKFGTEEDAMAFARFAVGSEVERVEDLN